MIPLFEYEGRGWTPFGFPMSQNRMALPVWSYAMEKHPPKTIVEIGTNCGGFTCVLAMHAWRIGCHIHTFDVMDAPTTDFRPFSNLLPITFYKMDCFSGVATDRIVQLMKQDGTAYLMCDGGNKVKEFNFFAPLLKSGDVIAAHDYSAREEYWPWSEVTVPQVRDAVNRHNLKPFMQEHFDMAGWLAYRKE